jgi:hypothetical protein
MEKNMFFVQIAQTIILFAKFFVAETVQRVMAEVEKVSPKNLLMVDTPSTEHLTVLIKALQEKGVVVHLRDHHNVLSPRNENEKKIAAAVQVNCELLGENAVVSDRETHPACSTLVTIGEFANCEVVIADPDADGLLGALKALGQTYPELDSDAAVLDGPRSAHGPESLSTLGWLFTRAMSTLPPFIPTKPEISENAKGELFQKFANAVSGDQDAMSWLEGKVASYEAGVKEAQRLLEQCVSSPYKGVVLCDTVGAKRHDLTTLTQGLELEGVKVTVVRKDNGPIATKHGGIQYSLAVVKKHQQECDLQKLLPEGFVSSPESGLISNTTFLLHVNEETWENVVLPGLPKFLS